MRARMQLGSRDSAVGRRMVGAQKPENPMLCREERGVRVRVELGPRDAVAGQCV